MTDFWPPRPPKRSLGDEPSIDELTKAGKGVLSWKAVEPDGHPAELIKIERAAFA